MASYLRSWLPSPFASAEPAAPTPTIVSEPPPPEHDDDSDTETVRGEDDDDVPPAFPAINSAQQLDSASSKAACDISTPQIVFKYEFPAAVSTS